jgi:hypothetical protein
LRLASSLIALLVAAAISVALTRYPGSASLFLVFNICCVALALAALPRPRAYVYTVLVAFLLLGLWAKTLVHTIWEPKFLEPVGGFGNSPAEWDQALAAMIAAALGVLGARGLHLVYGRRRPAPQRSAAPAWFIRHRRVLWVLTLIAVVAVNAANLKYAFYQIGVNTKGVLPLRLHVLFAWLVNIGFALWISVLLWWDYCARPSSLVRAILAAFCEALVSSVSAFSRILFLVHAGPYWLALLEERRRLAPSRRSITILAACFVLLFVTSVLAVFALRASYYPSNADLGRNIKLEIPQLVVQRWIGLEGVLAVGSLPGRDATLLVSALTESPKAGAESLYQRTARSHYRANETFTFGSNAGPVAVLLFSGSLVAVGLGMALLMLVLLATEEAASRLTGNPFLLGVSGAALANVASQTTFFYLTLIFLLQMWAALVVTGALSRGGK